MAGGTGVAGQIAPGSADASAEHATATSATGDDQPVGQSVRGLAHVGRPAAPPPPTQLFEDAGRRPGCRPAVRPPGTADVAPEVAGAARATHIDLQHIARDHRIVAVVVPPWPPEAPEPASPTPPAAPTATTWTEHTSAGTVNVATPTVVNVEVVAPDETAVRPIHPTASATPETTRSERLSTTAP